MTIFIRNGNYEEIVFFRKKANLTFRGEDREKVQVGYGNNSAFNPPMPGPSRRCAFSAYDSTGIELINFSLNNYYVGQAEALLVSGSKNIVSNMNLKGSGDALNLRGSVYLTDSTIIGDGDTILGVGPAFFRHCVIQSIGPFMWIRNTEANHGNVFVDCTFTAIKRPLPWNGGTALTPPSSVLARLPNNHGLNYPYAEAVLINCRLTGLPAAGWGPIDADTGAYSLLGVPQHRRRGPGDRHLTAASCFEAIDGASGREDHRRLQQSYICAGLDSCSRSVNETFERSKDRSPP